MVVELVKDDDLCNKIDDFVLFFFFYGSFDFCIMGVVRLFFVEDGIICFVFKLGVLVDEYSYVVMICWRFLVDFEYFVKLL